MRWAFAPVRRFLARWTLILLGLVWAQTASAQEPKTLAPPRGAEAQAYRQAVAGAGLQDDLLYLPPGVPLDAVVADPEEPEDQPAIGESPMAIRGAAWAVLAVFGAGLLVLAIRHRRLLGELFGRRDRWFGGAASGSPDAEDAPQIDHDLLARLRAEADPRVGLRLLLQRFLALAARENRIVLRRSLTTRELLRVLPGGWRHRDDLEQLASRVELTVFGGREMSRESYRECLDMAEPLLFRVEPRP